MLQFQPLLESQQLMLELLIQRCFVKTGASRPASSDKSAALEETASKNISLSRSPVRQLTAQLNILLRGTHLVAIFGRICVRARRHELGLRRDSAQARQLKRMGSSRAFSSVLARLSRKSRQALMSELTLRRTKRLPRSPRLSRSSSSR